MTLLCNKSTSDIQCIHTDSVLNEVVLYTNNKSWNNLYYICYSIDVQFKTHVVAPS